MQTEPNAVKVLTEKPLVESIETANKREEDRLNKPLHIDDFLDRVQLPGDEGLAYAHFMFTHWRKPAWMKMLHDQFLHQHKLFVDYEGKTWRVIGASRLGDIWLTEDFSREHGYDRRVDLVLAKFTNWRPHADRELTWPERVALGVKFYQMPPENELPKICNKHTSFLQRAGAPKRYIECTQEERAFLQQYRKDERRKARGY